MKQKTLEESLKDELEFIHNSVRNLDFDLGFKTGGIIGAKWQQEQNDLTPMDLIEFSKWVNKMGYSHRLTLIPNDLIDFYLKNKENIIKLNLE
jgi:hypothetical protein